MRARWLLQLQALSAYPTQESKNLLVKLWLLFEKENPFLGLFICLLLAKLCQTATLSCKGSGSLYCFQSSMQKKGRGEVDWDGLQVSQPTVFVKIYAITMFVI